MRAVVVAKERAETDISLSELNSLFHNGTALREPGAPKEANGQAVPNGDSQAEILAPIPRQCSIFSQQQSPALPTTSSSAR